MRIAFVVAVLALLVTSQVEAQASFWAESALVITDAGDLKPQVKTGASKSYDGSRFGFYTFGLVTKGWGMGVAGPSVSLDPLIPNVTVSFGIGMEKAENPWRTQSSVFAGFGRGYVLAILEVGGGGHWYLFESAYAFRNLSLGVYGTRTEGFGPVVKITKNLGTAQMMFMVTPTAYDFEGRGRGDTTLAFRFTP